MMRAISQQLYGSQDEYPTVRRYNRFWFFSCKRRTVEWLRRNENFDVDGSGTTISQFLDKDAYPSWENYCDSMEEDGHWYTPVGCSLTH